MRLKGEFKFMGIDVRPNRTDPTRMNYIVGLSQGLDTLRCYVEADAYARYCKFVPYSDVTAVLDFNPVAKSVTYAMHIVELFEGVES